MFIVCFQFSFEYFWVHQPKLRVIFTCAAVECCLPYHVHAGFLKTWFDRLWKDRQVVHRMTTSDHEWQQVVQRVTANDNQWYNEWKRMTTSGKTSDNEWQRVYNKWHRVTTNDDEWQQVVQRVTKSENEWQRVPTNGNEWQQVRAAVQRMKTAQNTSKNGSLPSFQWQKEIHYYFKGWMAAIRVVK